MNNCPNCGADMKHSPCCGRVDGLGDNLTRLRAQVDKLTAENESLERERAEAMNAGNGLYRAILDRVKPFFPEDTRDLDWDVLPSGLSSKLRTITTERDEARTIAAECYNAARWELSDQKAKQYAPIIYAWSQALTRHTPTEGT